MQTAVLDIKKHHSGFFFPFLRHSAELDTFQDHRMWFLLIREAETGLGKETELKLN